MSTSPWSQMEAERAFAVAARARRRAAIMCKLGRGPAGCDQLPVYDGPLAPRRDCGCLGGARAGLRDIRLDAIVGTLEPHRAAEFDPHFRPTPRIRERWQRVWAAQTRGVALPPITVVQVCDTFVIRDGHHRVSVARALGAESIAAIVHAR